MFIIVQIQSSVSHQSAAALALASLISPELASASVRDDSKESTSLPKVLVPFASNQSPFIALCYDNDLSS